MRTLLCVALLVSTASAQAKPAKQTFEAMDLTETPTPPPAPVVVPEPEPEPLSPSEPEPSVAASPTSLPALELSLKAGGHFPQLVNSLGTSFDGILKVGYAPLAGRQLQLLGEVGYSQPSHLTPSTDARLAEAGADYSSTLTVQDLSTTLGVAWLFHPPTAHLLPYAGAGLNVHWLRSKVVAGTVEGADFGAHQETAAQLGGLAFGGVALKLGPGALLGELRFSYAPVEQRVTGTANIGALSVLLGYGLWL